MLGLGNSVVTSGAPSAEFTLDQAGTMVHWYKFNEGQTPADSDSDGTDEVAQWNDSFGSNNISQSTAIKQPAYNSGHLDFDNSQSQKLQGSVFNGTGLTSFTIMFSIAPDDFAASRTVMGNSGVASHLFRFSSSNTNTRLQFQGAAFDSTASEAFGTSRFILTLTRDTSANPNPVKIYKNTTEVVSGTKTFGTQASLATFNQFGCQAGASNPFNGKISEVAIWSNVLSDSDRALAIADMQNRTGV